MGSPVQSKEFAHFLVQESAARAIGLNPLAIHDELWDGSLAYVTSQLVGSSWSIFDVDFCISDPVLFQEPFGFAAIAAP